MSRPRASVIVCGAGLAGLTAAVSAQEAGAKVTLIEKAPQIGGTTALSGGLVWTFTDLAEMEAYVPHGNLSLQGLLHQTLDNGRRWLETHGVQFYPEENVFIYGRGQRMDPNQGLEALSNAFERSGGTFLFETALDSILMRGNQVTGIRAMTADGESREIHGTGVVLATGGFQGNPELLRRYVAPPTSLYLRANPWSTGDGFLAASAIGAAATPALETFYGHALVGPPATFRPSDFRDASQIYGMKSVAVNLRGVRFCDESRGTGEEELNQELSLQPEGRGFYIVDSAVAAIESRPARRLTRVIIDWAKAHGAPVVAADTLSELAAALTDFGASGPAILRTLEDFNAACEQGRGNELSPRRELDQHALTEPPYFAIGVKASITFTMGGLAIDERARVLRRSGTSSPIAQSITDAIDFRELPINGLYSAGCDVGNVSNRGYVGGLSVALTTGRVAGKEAAAS